MVLLPPNMRRPRCPPRVQSFIMNMDGCGGERSRLSCKSPSAKKGGEGHQRSLFGEATGGDQCVSMCVCSLPSFFLFLLLFGYVSGCGGGEKGDGTSRQCWGHQRPSRGLARMDEKPRMWKKRKRKPFSVSAFLLEGEREGISFDQEAEKTSLRKKNDVQRISGFFPARLEHESAVFALEYAKKQRCNNYTRLLCSSVRLSRDQKRRKDCPALYGWVIGAKNQLAYQREKREESGRVFCRPLPQSPPIRPTQGKKNLSTELI